MTLAVGWARETDAEDLAHLLVEMDRHYRQPPLDPERALQAAVEWLARETSGNRHFALARQNGEVAGLASVAIAYPGGNLSRLMFLKDLFVLDAFRGNGIGHALMRFLAGYCREEGIGRIDLTTERWNEGALRLYHQLGAQPQDQKVFLRFDAEALSKLAGTR